MPFELVPEQKMWRDIVNRFMDERVTREYVRACDRERRYPYEAYRMVAEQGWLGLVVPEAYEGAGADVMTYVLFCEAFGKYGFDFSAAFSVPTFTVMNIVHHGTPEQKAYYLPRFVRGEVRFSISITEPNAGSDAAAVSTRARLEGDEFVLDGQKVFSSAAHAENNVIAMLVRTDPNAPRHEGLSLLLVPNTTPGLELRRLDTVARRATGTNEIFLTGARVPRTNLLGPLGGAWDLIREHLAFERLAVAASYVGNAQTAVDDAVAYARQRVQFGQPIGRFQVIRHMLAQAQTEVDAARLLTYHAATLVEQGAPGVREVSMAKLYASETLYRVATDGMQILGGYAQLPEYDMERYWREGKQAMIGGGSSQIQREIIGRSLGL